MVEEGPPKLLSSRKAGTLANIIRINTASTQEINQRPTAIWGACIEEKWLHIGKNSELCGIPVCPLLIHPSTMITWNASSLQSG